MKSPKSSHSCAKNSKAPNRPRRRLPRAIVSVAEQVECRAYLSFAPSVSGPVGPITTAQQYTAYIDVAGSVSPSQDVFHWGDTTSDTVNSPSNPQAKSHSYAASMTPYSPTGSATPSSGSGGMTLPVTLVSSFGISPTFSGKTLANSHGASGTNNGVGMYIDPSSEDIYVLATYNAGGTSTNEFAVTRFLSNGSVDTTGSFGTNGTVHFGFDSFNDTPAAIAIDGSDLIVAGTCHTGFCAAAISTFDGSFDTGFNSTGKLTGVTSGTCNAMVVQSNGKIVLIGTDGSKFLAFRITSAGATDNSFGSLGKQTVSFAGTSDAYAGVEASFVGSGDIILGGQACEACCGTDFAFAALKETDGSLDTGFNSTGKQTHNFCSANGNIDADYSLAVDGTNDRIVGGGVDGASSQQMGLVVLNSDGTKFNETTKEVASTSIAYSVAVQSADQKIVLAGTSTGFFSSGGTSNDFAVVRFNSNLTADNTFGSSDTAATDFSNTSFNDGYDVAKAVMVDSDGTIIAVGQSGSTSSGGVIALARYLPSNQIKVNAALGPFAVAAQPSLSATANQSGSGGEDPGSGDLITAAGLRKVRHRSGLASVYGS